MVNIKAAMAGEITLEDPEAKDRMAVLPVRSMRCRSGGSPVQTVPPLTDAHGDGGCSSHPGGQRRGKAPGTAVGRS